MAKKNILIVDDSALMRRLISDIINSDERFQVTDLAINGIEGLDLIVKNHTKYDAVILDINMPKMNGLELLEQLQKHRIKITVVMVSTLTKEGAKETMIALERGAFDFVTKPENYLDAKDARFKSRLLEIMCVAVGLDYKTSTAEDSNGKNSYQGKLGSPARDLKTTNLRGQETFSSLRARKPSFGPHKRFTGNKVGKSKLVAIASSTGGPKSLQSLIPLLPEDLDAPVVLVQHMPSGFTQSLAERLNSISKVKVKEAVDGEILQKGCVYIAPGGLHMKVVKVGASYKIVTTNEPARGGLRPCADVMYESLMDSSFDEITCAVLTGMGADGTNGIGALGEKKNIYVISQDAATCVVYGMPKAVAEAGLVDEVLPLQRIADAITKNVGVLNNGR